MKQIICLAGQPWSSSPGRTQQLLSSLRDTQVLYFSPAAGQLDRSYLKKGKKVRPNITAYTLPPTWVPVEETYGRLFRPGQRKIGRFIRSVAARHRFREPLLWATDPRQVHLLDLLDYGGLVYDCDREWEDLPLDWEGCLAGAADVVFAASPLLADRLAPCSSNVALLPNGVNFPLFSRPSDLSYDPLPQTAGPVLGWAGTIRPELDLEPLLYAARTMPRWTFVLLGPQGEGNSLLPRLRRLPNVVLPGAAPWPRCPTGSIAAMCCWTFSGTTAPVTTWSPAGCWSIWPPGGPWCLCCGPTRSSPCPTWYTGPTPIRSSSPSAATPWTSRPTSPPSAAAVTPLRPPGPCAVRRW